MLTDKELKKLKKVDMRVRSNTASRRDLIDGIRLKLKARK